MPVYTRLPSRVGDGVRPPKTPRVTDAAFASMTLPKVSRSVREMTDVEVPLAEICCGEAVISELIGETEPGMKVTVAVSTIVSPSAYPVITRSACATMLVTVAV